jgi:hypothetical protein
MADAFAKIKPTDPFRLTKQAAQRNRNWSDSSGSSLARADASRWARKESKRMKSSYRRPEVSTGREKAIRSGRFKYSCRIFCPVSFFFTPPHYSAELDTQSVFSSGEGKNFEKGESRGGKLCHAETSSAKKSKLIRFLLQFISQSRCLTMSV